MPVKDGAGSVVAHGGAWVGVRGGLLHVAEWDAGVEGGGDERVPQGVWADLLADPMLRRTPLCRTLTAFLTSLDAANLSRIHRFIARTIAMDSDARTGPGVA